MLQHNTDFTTKPPVEITSGSCKSQFQDFLEVNETAELKRDGIA
jgi:hypothetical protein